MCDNSVIKLATVKTLPSFFSKLTSAFFKKLRKSCSINKKALFLHPEIKRFSDKTVRNLRVSECHESVLSNDRAKADYLIK
jgi:hypothetical protein